MGDESNGSGGATDQVPPTDAATAVKTTLGAAANVPKCPIGAETTTHVVTQAPQGLSVTQTRAIEFLLDGTSLAVVAKMCGVDRRTVYRWRHDDAAFREELARGRRAIWADNADRMRLLIGRALDVLDEQLDEEAPRPRVQAAAMILSHSGLRKLMQDGLADGEQ